MQRQNAGPGNAIPADVCASTRSRLTEHLSFYEEQCERLAGFWVEHSRDTEHDGFLIPCNRRGQNLGTDKYLWCQARQTWTFAAFYNHIEKREVWRDMAESGRRFLIAHGHLGEGRWGYLCSRDGRMLNRNLSLVTDNNAATALAELATATGDPRDRDLIHLTLDQYLDRQNPPAVDEWYHHSLPPEYLWNGIDMLLLGSVPAIRDHVDAERLERAAEQAMQRILFVYAKDSHQALFEAVDPEGNTVDDDSGQRINPGHGLEALWFCLELAKQRDDQSKIDRAVEVVRWMFERGWDSQRGGMLAFTGPDGGKPRGAEAPVPWGERWDDRIWWVHSESLCALAMAGAVSGDPWFADAFDKLHDYVVEHFIDREYGEWYQYLDRYGQVISPQKGSWVKCFFHIPRNVMKLVLLMRQLRDSPGP